MFILETVGSSNRFPLIMGIASDYVNFDWFTRMAG